MKDKHFSTSDAFRFAGRTLLDHFGFFLKLFFVWSLSLFGIVSILGAITVVPFIEKFKSVFQDVQAGGLAQANGTVVAQSLANQGLGDGAFFIALSLFGFAVYLVFMFFKTGFTKITLDLYDKDDSTVKTLFSGGRYLFRIIVATTLYMLMIGGGVVLFIVPGIYFAIKYAFYMYAIIDKNAGILESFSESAKLTHDAKWELFGLAVLTGALNSFAASAFGIGLLIISPLITLVWTYVYRKLDEAHRSPQSQF